MGCGIAKTTWWRLAVLGCLGLAAGVRAESVPIGRYLEIPFGISKEHPCPAEGIDARRSGRSRARVAQQTPRLLWKKKLGSARLTAPTVTAAGRLFLGSETGVAAVDAGGEQLWVRPVGTVRMQPALTPSGSVLVVTLKGELLELSPGGDVRQVPTGVPVRGLPLVLDSGEVAVGARDGSIYVFDGQGARVGSVASHHSGRISIARLSSRYLVSAGTDAEIHLFSVDGGRHHVIRVASGLLSGPVIGSDGTVWVVRKDRALIGLSAGGRVRAQTHPRLRAFRDPPAIGRDGALRMGALGNMLVCIGPNGTRRWHLDLGGQLGPVTLDADDVALVISSPGVLYGVEPDGKERFRVNLRARGAPRPVLGGDGTIYLACEDGTLMAWR